VIDGLPALAGAEARSLGRSLDLTTTIAEWLRSQGHGDSDATRRFLAPKLQHLSAPDGMADRSLAADRLASAVRRKERIAVFGDYDCDGITSAAIMTEVLRALGGDVTPLLASRFDGGASGQAHFGSKAHDGWKAKLRSTTSLPAAGSPPRSAPFAVSSR